jgi:hypothetical protein
MTICWRLVNRSNWPRQASSLPLAVAMRHGPDERAPTSGRFGDQVVIRVADHPDARKFTQRQLSSHVNATVDVRRIGLATRDKITAFEQRSLLVRAPDQPMCSAAPTRPRGRRSRIGFAPRAAALATRCRRSPMQRHACSGSKCSRDNPVPCPRFSVWSVCG